MAKKCTLLVNNRWGYVATPMEFNSIRAAVKYAHSPNADGWFAYRVVIGDVVVKRGYCYAYV